MKKILSIALGAFFMCSAAAPAFGAPKLPVWVERDSVAAVQSRLRSDFTMTRSEVAKGLAEKYGKAYADSIDYALEHKYLEAIKIDGKERFHRKSVRNFALLNPAIAGYGRVRGDRASELRKAHVDSVLGWYNKTNPQGLRRRVTYRFSIDVPYDKALVGDTLRVWMPLPLNNARCGRQGDVKILSASPARYVLSGDKSVHNTVYFEAPAPRKKGETAHFEYTGEYVASGAFVDYKDIEAKMRPYNTNSKIYKEYTRLPDGPHMINIKDLAEKVTAGARTPLEKSEAVFNYIAANYPWAGAREYSTIECIPQYVIDQKHGDCGQVSLLYISMMRSLGIPARWESGWMLHPDDINFHDWAEVYFEGVGWVPVDVSFGRLTGSRKETVRNFFSHGIDSYRFATNKGVGGALYPAKKWVRSETVDFQTGEVETSKGNLFYPGWKFKMEVLSSEPLTYVKANNKKAKNVLAKVKERVAPDSRQDVFEVDATQNFAGEIVLRGAVSEERAHKAVAKAMDKAGLAYKDSIKVYPKDQWAMTRITAASHRTRGAHAGEMATQSVMGTPLRVLEKGGEWWRVQTPDGYIAYVPSSSVVDKTAEEMKAWRKAPRVIVSSLYQTRVYANATTTSPRQVVSDLVNGNILERVGKAKENGRIEVKLPDGRTGWVDAKDVMPLKEWAAQEFDANKILDIAYSMEGTPYLWGGTSVKALDCSGLAKVSYYSNGLILMRDASQQALTGTRIEAADWRKCEPGDLLFFGNAKTGKVTHVAIYDVDGNYVHSSGRVKRNSVDPKSESYLTTPFLHAVRIHGNEGSKGITRAAEHPWYFPQKKQDNKK